jgi:hypothetical protein
MAGKTLLRHSILAPSPFSNTTTGPERVCATNSSCRSLICFVRVSGSAAQPESKAKASRMKRRMDLPFRISQPNSIGVTHFHSAREGKAQVDDVLLVLKLRHLGVHEASVFVAGECHAAEGISR